MSFDLYFFHNEAIEYKISDVMDYLKGKPYFKLPDVDGDEFIISYMNPYTGVDFYLAYQKSNTGIEERDDQGNVTARFFNTDLTFRINVNRATFFGYEALSIIGELADKFDWFVINPQNEGIPKKYTTEDLLHSWLETNRRAIETVKDYNEMRGSSSISIEVPAEQSLEWWKKTYEMSRFIEEHDESFLIPKISLFEDEEGKALSIVQWNGEHPQVIPTCDFFYVKYKKKWKWAPFLSSERVGLVRHRDLAKELETCLLPFSTELSDIKLLPKEHVKLANRLLDQIQLQPILPLREIEPSMIVDKI